MKHQVFQSQATDLPQFALLFIYMEFATSIIAEDNIHFKHLSSDIVPDLDSVLAQTEYDRFLCALAF